MRSFPVRISRLWIRIRESLTVKDQGDVRVKITATSAFAGSMSEEKEFHVTKLCEAKVVNYHGGTVTQESQVLKKGEYLNQRHPKERALYSSGGELPEQTEII